MERSYEAQKRQAHVKQLRKLASTLPFSITEEIDALRSDIRLSGYHQAGHYLDEDLRATIIAASTILAAAQAALSLRRGGDGTTVEAPRDPKPRADGAAEMQREAFPSSGLAKLDALDQRPVL